MDASPFQPSGPGPHRVELVVRGRVQGVGFRAFVLRRATALGLRGWVRNEPDGTVTAVAEGSADQLQDLIEACRQGPRSARVTGLEVRWQPAQGLPAGFHIR